MAKKKTVKRANRQPRSSSSMWAELDAKHPNLVWLLGLLIVVFLGVWYIHHMREESGTDVDVRPNVYVGPMVSPTLNPSPSVSQTNTGY